MVTTIGECLQGILSYSFTFTKLLYRTDLHSPVLGNLLFSVLDSVCVSVCLSAESEEILGFGSLMELVDFGVTIHPGFPRLLESPGFFVFKILGPGKSWKITLVLESPGN